jgi:hypothetical protein
LEKKAAEAAAKAAVSVERKGREERKSEREDRWSTEDGKGEIK